SPKLVNFVLTCGTIGTMLTRSKQYRQQCGNTVLPLRRQKHLSNALRRFLDYCDPANVPRYSHE
ncbi:hypothetical protein O5264_28120, partial [Escherichia coli]|nr:hypothetical protein [Escherichia coli]